ncbi:MAG TPA: hypothetical protein VE398_02945 [Acidobacteriota bacterium]|nr:hypothetical protein [Acidobacteriota bacterium]
MKRKTLLLSALLSLLLITPLVWGDEIILKSGNRYSGKFVRGDSNTVEFRILDNVQTFKTTDVAQIVFKEPALESPAPDRRFSTTPNTGSGTVSQPQNTPPAREVASTPSRSLPPAAASNTLPSGTAVTIRTTTVIDTDRNRVGDSFDATIEDPVVLGDQTVFPRGTPVKGRIAYAKESGRIAGQSQLVLELTEIDANGKRYTLNTTDYTEVGSSRGQRTAATVGGTAALGAIIGAIAGGGKGAAVGAASGAAVGTGVQVLTKGQTLKIPAETVLEFRLQAPLAVDAP